MKARFWYLVAVIVALLVALRFIARSREGFVDTPNEGAPAFVLYYADWCPHCKTVKPEFETFSKNGFVTIGGTNVSVRMIEATKNPEIMKKNNVKGYPTFHFYSADGKTVEYTGDRTVQAYLDFLKNQLQVDSAQSA